MASLNKVFLLGNLTRDPDLRGLPSGQSVCELGIAVSRRYVGSNGQEVEDTCFVDVSVWGKMANVCKQYLAKGSQVMIEGRLQLDRWEDRNGGGQRSKLRVVAEQVQFLNRRQQADNPYSQDSGYAPQAQGGYASQPQGGYGAPAQGNYPPPAQGGYSAYQGGNYPPPRNDAPYGEAQNNYNRASRPVPPPAAPPMPEPGMDAGAEEGVDDIPF